ncbi:OPT oligopeptide transporter protein-domain-containing protein [Obelidium mucronatum]|nr:OPT oligopeptide transporter protein-domain-containing protein [Obelidium mucronatum]
MTREGTSGIQLDELHVVSSDEDLLDKEDEYIDEIYDIIDAVAPRSDKPSLKALTFRMWFLGILFGTLMCVANTIFTFRANAFTITPIIAAILAYPAGEAMARYLPRGILNPGRFNHKEHGLIFIVASAMSSTPYALKNIVIQKYILKQDLSLGSCLVFAMATQCFGYSFAGLCRRYLVRPAAMMWPSNLATVAMLHSLHSEKKDTSFERYPMSRYKFFWLVTTAMAFWQFLPSLVAPMLTAFSVLCFFSDRSGSTKSPQLLHVLGSARSGVGFLSFTLDWSLINAYGPITTPLWASLNQFLGLYVCLWVLVPVLWSYQAFGADKLLGTTLQEGPNGTDSSFPLGFALNSPDIFTSSGTKLNLTDAFTWPEKLPAFKFQNETVNMTTYFAVEYMTAFMVFVASLVHVAIWYGPELWYRFTAKLEELDTEDIHNVLMDVYPDVPEAWYLSLLTWTGVWTIFVCQTERAFNLPWFGVILAITTAMCSIVPLGIIQAISGQLVPLKAVGELISGMLFPNDILAVMTFKTLSSVAMSQGLGLVSDMKLGHYLKIPPRSLFLAQFVGSVLGAVISTAIAIATCDFLSSQGGPSKLGGLSSIVSNVMATSSWTGVQYQTFLSEGILFGAIGPKVLFGLDKHYAKVLLGFAVGLILPIIPWAMHFVQPSGYWHLVNLPLIFVFPSQIGGLRSDLISPLLVAIGFNYYIKVYRNLWWKKYAYVLSAAFDSGATITLLIVFILTSMIPNWNIAFPRHFLNPADMERCAPDFYLTCVDHRIMGNAFGNTYDIKKDSYCSEVVRFQTATNNGLVKPADV